MTMNGSIDNGKLTMDNKNNFQLPKGWEIKKLGEVCEIGSGNSAPQKKEMFENGEYPFIRTSDVGKIHIGFISDTNDKINNLAIKKMKIHKKGTLLLPKSGASTFINHRVMMLLDGYVSSHLAAIKADENILDNKYLFYYSIGIDSKDLMQDQNYPSLKLSVIKQIEIPIPPLPEQKRIVAILDRAFEAIDKAKANAEQNLKNAKELFESYSRTLYEKLISENEKELLGSLAKLVRGPFGGSLKKSMFVEKGYAVYEQRNAIGDFTDNFRYFIDEKKFNEMKRFSVNTGDMLMSCSGTIGKFTIVKEDYTKGIINQALLKITPDINKINNKFLLFVLGNFIQDGSSHSKGAAIKNIIAVKELKKIEIPLLNIEKQRQIVAQLDKLQTETKKLEAIYQKKIEDLEELKKSILQKAFNGEL